jgi:diguanylate cyclase (GGDEF)-like protein
MNSMEHTNSPPLVLRFLQEEFDKRRFPESLWKELEIEYGDTLYTELLYALTQLQFEDDEARMHWRNILDHREALERANGRDVGLRVALADYFININPKVENPILVEINLILKKEETALRDELTGLFNRRFFNRALHQEMDRSRRYQEPVSLLMMDIDNFKDFNDTHGHPSGDQALWEVAQQLKLTGRNIDHLTRYGGEEFAVILPRSSRDQALIAAERFREVIEQHCFLDRDDLHLTISGGVATFPQDAADGLQLLEKADQALYMAKREGRNRIVSIARDRRQHTRFSLKIQMDYRLFGRENGLHQGRTKNISAGGLMGEIHESVDTGEKIGFRFAVHDGGPELDLNGECVRVTADSEDPGLINIGVRFDFDNSAQEAAVVNFIDEMRAG